MSIVSQCEDNESTRILKDRTAFDLLQESRMSHFLQDLEEKALDCGLSPEILLMVLNPTALRSINEMCRWVTFEDLARRAKGRLESK